MIDTTDSTPEAGTSTELTGGAGFTYEDGVVGYYLAALLQEATAAGGSGSVVRVAVQQRSAGEPLDDVVVDARDAFGEKRLSLQVKRTLRISAAVSNEDFREVLSDCRATRANPLFRVDRDAYGFVAESLLGPVDDFRRLIELAGASSNAKEFVTRFGDEGATSAPLRSLRSKLRPLVADDDDDEWQFYRHFKMPDLAGLQPDGALTAAIHSNLAVVLAEGQTGSGLSLWQSICRLAREGAGAGKIWTRPVLLNDLAKSYRFRGLPGYADDREIISRLAQTALADISDETGAYHVNRSSRVDQALALLDKHRLVNLTGLPGSGKSAILRNAVEAMQGQGPVLFLKSDHLFGSDWQSFAVSKGLTNTDPARLLAELGSSGNRVLFIDGIDRIPPPQRAIAKDLMRALIEEPGLAGWRVLVTSRNQGMEPFRVWIPSALHAKGGIGELAVDVFDDGEATALADKIPALQPLLFGPDAVRSIARRPFFAAILIGQGTTAGDEAAARSETDLITYWWSGGGYDATGPSLVMRQRALLELSRVGARSLGKSIRAISLTPETATHLSELVDDGIIRSADENATYSFTHDIFFEWAYFRLLVGLDNDWVTALTEAGQPPLLGRVVGLLAQRAVIAGAAWNEGLDRLEAAQLRPQWRRAWLTGPALGSRFTETRDRFTATMEADNWALLRSFLVWFQAEHTIPNPQVLENQQLVMDVPTRIRMADMTGWPGDLQSWIRVIAWLLSLSDRLPVRLLPLVLEVFKVWQNQFVGTPNPISGMLLKRLSLWIDEIDAVVHAKPHNYEYGRWDELRGEVLKDFELGIRQTIFMAMRNYPAHGEAMLDRMLANEDLRSHCYEEVMALAPVIAPVSPQKLADLCRLEIMQPLPIEAKKTHDEEDNFGSPWEGHLNFQLRELSLESHHGYFPPSPLHEPFKSLFAASPDVARALVRDMGNHATTSWLQLHEIASARIGTPIPLDLSFPWGDQQFWGAWDNYNWVGDHPAPHALACAFMALAYWAHHQLDAGKDVDEVIRLVVEGHQSIGVLSLAGALALEKNRVSATVLSIASDQRLWRFDEARNLQHPFRNLDPLGIRLPTELTGERAAAMAYLKVRPSGMRQLNELAFFFAHSSDDVLRQAFRDRVASFPQNLPFEFEEERTDLEYANTLKQRAEQWAGLGDKANYQTTPVPDSNLVRVDFHPPTPLPEATRQRAEEAAISLNEYVVFDWARRSLSTMTIDPRTTLESALIFVRPRDSACLFDRLTPSGGGMRQSAVSSVAAVVLLVGPASVEEIAWADDVLVRIEAMAEDREEQGLGNMPWHPGFHVVFALRANLSKKERATDAAQRLLKLCLHPNDYVAKAALAALLRADDLSLAWNATVLASDLWHYHQPKILKGGTRDHSRQRQWEADALQRALARLADGTMGEASALPPPWPRRARNRLPFDEHADAEPVVIFRYDFAEEVARSISIEAFGQSGVYQPLILNLARKLASWTAARFIQPSPSDDSSGRRKRSTEHINLNTWPDRLGELLSRISPFVSVEAMRADYLDQFLEPGDENGLDVTASFATDLVCRHIFDAPEVSATTMDLLQLCAAQLLGDPVFRRSSRRGGELHGSNLPRLLKAVLMVPFDDHAAGAVRFANGNWSELATVLPLIDRVVGEAGWSVAVVGTFLKLVERIGMAYPLDAFVSTITKVLVELGDNALGWVGTILPARIAGVIQILSDAGYPLSVGQATAVLQVLDLLIDLGDRRAAAIEESQTFRATQTGST
ncbi:ATP-binding protein [Rhizobium leguminosarum]|uniref:ATP-binding protein n=1 Tax=Rhizobium leguminosarum TaxID=384 RepID=UPI0010308A36|nr:ATP-binding protein [Rhizobium leguminosarum]TAY85452.1 AAA family ATPase [Rhizobium leguminosarum]TAZ02899.1 AAA family ATPase [Rhizobium leguminosarum]